MKYIAIFIILIISQIDLHSQNVYLDCALKVRVNNKTKYQINKLLLLGNQLDSVKPNTRTEYFCVDGMYNTLGFDITISRKSIFRKYEWAHEILMPIDYVGESLIESGTFELILSIKRKGKDKYKIDFERKEIINLL